MERRGLLESEWEHTDAGPDRRIYKVTTRGADVLENGLESIIKRKAMMDNLVEFYKKHFKTGEGGEQTDA
jgi:DNA-binding PadR family transcriptional regulator